MYYLLSSYIVRESSFKFFVSIMEGRCVDAFSSNNKEEALRLLKLVNDPRKVKDISGDTLLHWAAVWGWTDIVELLITKYKCDVNCGDVDNCTPVHLASMNGHLDVIKYLVNNGKCDLFIKTKDGDTPLDLARSYRRHEIVEFITNVMTTSTLTCK